MPFRLNSVVLTGATSGLGEEMAYRLAGQGAWLTLAGRNEEKLEEVAYRCAILGREKRARVQAIPTDVTNPEQCAALINNAVSEYKRIDTLINNAGQIMKGAFSDSDSFDPYHEIMAVNYFGILHCTRYALPYLHESKGRLAAISGFLGQVGAPYYSGYVASKAAVSGFLSSLRLELADSNVSVTVVHPGAMATGIHRRGMDGEGRPIGDAAASLDRDGTAVDVMAQKILTTIIQRGRGDMLTLNGKLATIVHAIAPGVIESAVRGRVLRQEESGQIQSGSPIVQGDEDIDLPDGQLVAN